MRVARRAKTSYDAFPSPEILEVLKILTALYSYFADLNEHISIEARLKPWTLRNF